MRLLRWRAHGRSRPNANGPRTRVRDVALLLVMVGALTAFVAGALPAGAAIPSNYLVVVDQGGARNEVPVDDWVEVGVFGEGEPYMELRRLRSGRQTITVRSFPTSEWTPSACPMVPLDRLAGARVRVRSRR